MTTLRPELSEALSRLHPGAAIETLPGDASSRRFHRLSPVSGGSVVVMDYGAPFEGETEDVRLARIFERAALPVARVLDVLPEGGCLVLEDLGDVTLEAALVKASGGRSPSRVELYRAAVRLAADIATRGTEALARSDRSVGPSLDFERFSFEMRFFETHFIGAFLGRGPAAPALVQELDELARRSAAHPKVLCHRDFHSRNVMVRSDGTLAMVDIQDARWGPDSYDLASLLRDAYVDIDEEEVSSYLDAYIACLPGRPDAEVFRRRFEVIATQRMIKALGTFGYQVAVLQRERYRPALLRTLGRLKEALSRDPANAPLDDALRESAVYG